MPITRSGGYAEEGDLGQRTSGDDNGAVGYVGPSSDVAGMNVSIQDLVKLVVSSMKEAQPKIRKVTNEADKAFVEWIKKKESKTDSARKMFLLSLLPDVENLSEEQMRKFRIKVLLLLEEIQSDQSLQPKVPPQYGNTYAPIQQTQQYRDNYSPISSVDSPSNYSASTSISEHLSQLDHFESLQSLKYLKRIIFNIL
ncbi:hypothetical protein FQR65_LT19561 [Abscondita terminalis]|nr:hypothetical protein FQR65_LT19561 [Abscondita terminalis]